MLNSLYFVTCKSVGHNGLSIHLLCFSFKAAYEISKFLQIKNVGSTWACQGTGLGSDSLHSLVCIPLSLCSSPSGYALSPSHSTLFLTEAVLAFPPPHWKAH